MSNNNYIYFHIGMNIILGAAEGEIVADPDVQKAALRVIVNCVCAPITRVGIVLMIYNFDFLLNSFRNIILCFVCENKKKTFYTGWRYFRTIFSYSNQLSKQKVEVQKFRRINPKNLGLRSME